MNQPMKRYYRFGPFAVDTQVPVLVTRAGETSLEPRVHELLVFFCANAGQLVTRDQLLTAIWQGGIVSDNAVSKLIARLRNVLDDDSRAPRYIQTVSGRGYRLAVTVTSTDAVSRAALDAGRGRAVLRWVAGVLLVVVVVVGSLLWLDGVEPERGPYPVRPLTRHSGTEFGPAMSPDGRFLAYTHRQSARSERELWLTDYQRDTEVRLEVDGVLGDVLAWMPDSRRLAIVSLVDGACRVRLLALDARGAVVGDRELIDCDGRSLGDLVFSTGGDQLYYTSRERAFQPVQLFVEDLDEGGSTLAAQPPLRGAGNYSIDLSPGGDKLLILSADESYRSQIHVLSLATETLTSHARFDHFVDDAIWHHDNESVVHLSAPLGYELVRSALDGSLLETVVSTSSRIVDFARHPNGTDVYFASFQMDNDLVHVAPGSREQSPLDNTAVYEHLPALSVRSDHLVFLSNRGGPTQVYLGQLHKPGSRQITTFRDSRLFVSLALSPDASRFALATYTEIQIMGAARGELIRSTHSEGLILSADWLGERRLAVSHLDDHRPRLFIYDAVADALAAAPARWSAATADFTGAETAWYAVDQDGAVHRTDETLSDAVDTGLRLPRTFYLTGLNLKAANGRLHYQRNDGLQSTIVQFDPATGQSEILGTWDFVAGFDVGPAGLVVSHEVGRVGDVVSTARGDSWTYR